MEDNAYSNNSNQNDNSKKIYLAIIAVLLIINGVAGYLLYTENKTSKEKTETIAKMDTDAKELNTQLESTKQELEGLKGKNAELDGIVAQRQAEIEKVQAELAEAQRKGKLSAAELAKFKQQIVQLQTENADLQAKVKELSSKNEELTAKNLQVSQDLEKEKQSTARLSEDNAAKQKLVELGSLLQPQNLKVEGVHRKKSGKETDQTKAKNVDYLKISFTTGDNKVLPVGPLKLYVRIINPKGETISVAEQGSGTMKTAEGTDAQYTKVVDLDWDQSSKNVAIEWSQDIKNPGTYKVELYQAGHIIGQGSVLLK
ncbi:MAG: hypothetical protein U0T73_11605 [Chitinophagales bacterium]